MPDLFDPDLRIRRRDRAIRRGPATFLLDRAVDDIVDRLSMMQRTFERALLIGAPTAHVVGRLAPFASHWSVRDPSPLAAAARGTEPLIETQLSGEPQSVDLVVALATFDTLDALPDVLMRCRILLCPDRPLIGVMAGGDSLPALRHAMRAADAARADGGASPHVHPRIEPAGIAGLLQQAGFAMPVVDVDRVRLRYASLDRLVFDLRDMGATNILARRDRRPILRSGLDAARSAFAALAAPDGHTEERIELLHFLGWTPADPQ